MEPPTPRIEPEARPIADLSARLQRLEHSCGAVLYLSAINLFANLVTVLIAVWALVA